MLKFIKVGHGEAYNVDTFAEIYIRGCEMPGVTVFTPTGTVTKFYSVIASLKPNSIPHSNRTVLIENFITREEAEQFIDSFLKAVNS